MPNEREARQAQSGCGSGRGRTPTPAELRQAAVLAAGDRTLSPEERRHRAYTLEEIARRVETDGPHTARAHPDRGRLFMPFAALKGYHEQAHSMELDE